MLSFFFEIDFKALLLLACAFPIFYYLWKWQQTFAKPTISFSNLSALSTKSTKVAWAFLPQVLLLTAFGSFVLAFIDPHFLVDRRLDSTGAALPQKMPTEGIAIYLVLDQSGSMKEKVAVQTSDSFGLISKIDLLKKVSKQFIIGDPKLALKGRPDDMIGLIFFARAAHVMAPLTLDHTAILEELDKFQPVGDRNQDGTSIGYAIFKTANMIAATRHYAQDLISKGEPAYTIKSSVMILITDGLQDPNPLDKGKRLRNIDVPEAAAYAKEQGVRLYIINVEPKLGTADYAPYRNIMQRAAELTGGKFYMVDSSKNLEQIYTEIDGLEKSALPDPLAIDKDQRPDLYRRVSWYPYLIGLGLLSLLSSILLEAFVFRRVP